MLPESFPIPKIGSDFGGKREAELMSEHADLSTVVGFVGKHVDEHGRAGSPRARPTIAMKVFNATPWSESLREHLGTESSGFRESFISLQLGTAVAVELGRPFEVRGRQTEPCEAKVVNVGKYGGDGAVMVAGKLSMPDARIERLEEYFVQAIVDHERPL